MTVPPGAGAASLVAPAKLTVSLRVAGRRPDGYHFIEAEMVCLDLHDVLDVDEGGEGVEIVHEEGARAEGLSGGPDNIVARALAAVGRRAAVRIRKRIPVGGGLGGGSADAAAVLRWAEVDDLGLAASLGADVPFCVRGGRAIVGGIGEHVTPLPFEERSFVLLVPPFPVDTARVYRAWDELVGERGRANPRRRWAASLDPDGRNDLMAAAIAVEPRLEPWGVRLGEVTGGTPVLAGSGSTWWVEGRAEELGVTASRAVVSGGDEGRLIPVRTVPAGWPGLGSEPGPAGRDGPSGAPRPQR